MSKHVVKRSMFSPADMALSHWPHPHLIPTFDFISLISPSPHLPVSQYNTNILFTSNLQNGQHRNPRPLCRRFLPGPGKQPVHTSHMLPPTSTTNSITPDWHLFAFSRRPSRRHPATGWNLRLEVCHAFRRHNPWYVRSTYRKTIILYNYYTTLCSIFIVPYSIPRSPPQFQLRFWFLSMWDSFPSSPPTVGCICPCSWNWNHRR